MNKKVLMITGIIIAFILGFALSFLIFRNNKNEPEPIIVNEITIKFDVDGGKNIDDLKINKGSKEILPKTSKEGYVFKGWYVNDKEITDDYIFNENLTLKAKWEKEKEEVKTFKVTYDSKGGSVVNPTTVECGKLLKLPSNPTKSGYRFMCWEDQNARCIYNDAFLACEDLTLYASWEKE